MRGHSQYTGAKLVGAEGEIGTVQRILHQILSSLVDFVGQIMYCAWQPLIYHAITTFVRLLEWDKPHEDQQKM